jgi:MFS family permease
VTERPQPQPQTDACDPDGLDELAVCEADLVEPRAEVVRQGGTFESFRYRAYTLFWSGALVSNVGTWMQNYALGIVVYSFRRSSLDLGLVSFVSGIPVLFLALPAGVLADRVSKRRLIMGAQAVLLVQALALAALFNSGRLSSAAPKTSLLWVGGLGFVGGVMAALTFPAWQAYLPELVPRRSLLNAIALNSAQFQSSRLLGPLIAGALVLAGAGMGEIFYANAASFLVVIGALWAIGSVRKTAEADARTAANRTVEREGTIATLLAGVRYARENPAVGVLLINVAVLTIFGFPYLTLLPAIANETLGFAEGSDAYNRAVAWIMAANGLGAVIGALGVASLPRQVRRERLIPASMLAFTFAISGFALSKSLWLTIALSTIAGVAILTTNSLANTSIQSAVPGHLRGRVMALFVLAFIGIMPISSLLFGWIASMIGPSKAVLLGAAALGVWALLLATRPSIIATTPPADVGGEARA